MFKETVTDVFFDLDHTLWDFEKNSGLAFEHIFRKYELSINLNDFLNTYAPINHAYWKLYREERISKVDLRYKRLKNTFDKLNYRVDDNLINILSEAYIEHLPNHEHLFTGTFEILNYLKVYYNLHIITNGFEEVQLLKMKSSGILPYFQCIVNSEMVGVKKPNPKIFLHALELADVSPEKTIMIGDNLEADILGALNVGMYALHFNSNNEQKHSHTQIINNLSEIKRYL